MRLVFMVAFCLLVFSSHGQQKKWDIRIASFQQLGYSGKAQFGHNGFGLATSVYWPSRKSYHWETGIEFSSVSWGNQVLATMGHRYQWPAAGKWWFDAGISTQQGIALFRPKSLYVGGLSVNGSI